MRHDPRFLGRAALSILVLVVCAGILEGGARLAGYAPWPVNRGLLGQSEGLHRVDAKLGWKKQEGQFRIERFGREIEVSHWPAERRATSAEPVARARQILVLGGSFAYGLGLSDDETFPWMMQQRDWRFEWLNLATSGYGTYQALLTLEEHLASHERVPELVIYGYNWFHAERNVAADSWQYAMAVSSPGVRLPLPFVTLAGADGLSRGIHFYPEWPFRRQSAAVALLERAWNKMQVRGREAQAHEATRRLVIELDELTRSRGSRLLVMIMGRKDISPFLEQRNVLFVECMPPSYTPEMTLPDAHPTGIRNAYYADCLASFLAAEGLLDFS
jgi:hypothetical protein